MTMSVGCDLSSSACSGLILWVSACLLLVSGGESVLLKGNGLPKRIGFATARNVTTTAHRGSFFDDAGEARATFYTDFRETACFDTDHSQFLPHNHIVAVRHDLFSRDLCGNCLKVTCKGGTQDDGNPCDGDHASVVVVIADRCAGSCAGELDLGQPAYDKIAGETEGVIVVEYETVDCP